MFVFFCQAILDSYSGIIHGLDEVKDPTVLNLIVAQLNYIAPLIIYIAQNCTILQNEDLEKATIGCLGDLFQVFDQEKTKELAKIPIIKQFVSSCMASTDDEIKKIGYWVNETIPN